MSFFARPSQGPSSCLRAAQTIAAFIASVFAAGFLSQHSVAQTLTVATQIGLGVNYICALTGTGGVKCWQAPGSSTATNPRGALGHGLATGSLTPVDVVGLTSGVTQISVGRSHACALLDTGAVKCWGDNQYSALGDPTIGTLASNASGQTFSNVPVQVAGITSGATAVATGESYSCALLTDGSVKCWGGGGTTSMPYYTAATGVGSNTPVTALGFSANVVAIAAGQQHFCAVMAGGGIRCQGDNTFAGNTSSTVVGAYTGRDLPTFGTGNKAVSTNAYFVCALNASNGLVCWGAGASGQLGNGSASNSGTAVNVSGLSANVSAMGTSGTGQNLGGFGYACAVISGAVKCWGNNVYGELGDGTTTQRNSPVQVTGITSGAVAVDGEYSRTCVLMNDGGIKCWGNPSSGAPTAVTGFGGGSAPGAPQGVSGVAGNGGITVSFSAPASNGGAAITSYTVTCASGASTITATGSGSPITVPGLTNGLAYTCTVTAQNALGIGAPSGSVGPLTPAIPAQVITFPQPASPIAFGAGLSFNVSATTTSTSPVVFSVATPAVCTVSANVVTLLQPGFCVINANAAADANFAGAAQVSRTVVISAACLMDIDQDGAVLPLTDGLLILRRMLGLQSNALVNNAVNPLGNRRNSVDVANAIDPMLNGLTLDVDGDGVAQSNTDGVLLLRALFGFGGSSVTSGALGGPTRTRGDWLSIRSYLASQCGLTNLAPAP